MSETVIIVSQPVRPAKVDPRIFIHDSGGRPAKRGLARRSHREAGTWLSSEECEDLNRRDSERSRRDLRRRGTSAYLVFVRKT